MITIGFFEGLSAATAGTMAPDRKKDSAQMEKKFFSIDASFNKEFV
jgi:hypothetical protein